jgi:hypothetical protein
MKKTAIVLILGLSLAMTGFAQKKPKGRPSVSKSAASNPIVADDRDRAAASKSKPPKVESPRPASGPTIVRAKPKPSQLMMALDANEDGKLSLEEIKAAVEAFEALDENKDGELTLNEFGPAPELTKPSRGDGTSAKGGALSSTLKAGAKPSGRPGRRPTAKPIGSPKAIAGQTPDTKRPGARATRPGAKPRPSSKPGQANRGDGASDLASSGGAPTAQAPPRRVARKAPARKVSKASRLPTAGALTADPEIKALIVETETVTKKIRSATANIKNLAKKQAARNWVRRGSRALLRSLNNIEGQDAGKKAVQVEEAKLKLAEVKKLLE